MDLLILRHGPAEERGSAYPDDTLRPLTAEGRGRVASIGRGLRKVGVDAELVLSSPLVRARETAEIVLSTLGSGARFELSSALEPGGDPRVALRWLAAEAPKAPSALLVGHEPDLSQFVASLITGGGSAAVRMKKGGLACVRLGHWNAAEGELRFLLEPRHLIRLG